MEKHHLANALLIRDQENVFSEKMQTLQQTLTEERDKVLYSANQQRSLLEESLHNTKSEEQRLRTKLAEAEEVSCNPYSCRYTNKNISAILVVVILSVYSKRYA